MNKTGAEVELYRTLKLQILARLAQLKVRVTTTTEVNEQKGFNDNLRINNNRNGNDLSQVCDHVTPEK